MTCELVKLPVVIYDVRAKNGTWCTLPYPNHPKGCPNFLKGCTECGDFQDINKPQKNTMSTHICNYEWYAVIEEFNLKEHVQKMKQKHPTWTDRQCRNLLYWQSRVMLRLEAKAKKYLKKLSTRPDGFCFDWACIILEVPEAHGVNVFGTMAKAGVILYKNPDLVRKIMFIGINHLTPLPEIKEVC